LKPLKQFLLFLVYSNLFIAACAVLMVQQTAYLFSGNIVSPDLVRFVFFSTLCSYSFHYYLTTQSVVPSQRIIWLKKNRQVHTVFFIVGLAGAVFFFIRLKEFGLWLLPAVVATFLYSAPKIPHSLFHILRKVAIGKTIFLSFIWMYVTSVLPIIVSGIDWNNGHTLYAASRFFFIYCICILFDYRDRGDDKLAGVRSLITFLSEKNITRLFIFSWVIFAALTILLSNYHISTLDIILLLAPGLLLAMIYNYARRNFSDMVYYVWLDGLMALSAMLMLLPLRS
jgi:4-hydroxybenzoate polyprenyltransferase